MIATLLRKEFTQELQHSRIEIEKLVGALGKQQEIFQSALKEQAQAFQAQLDASIQANKELQASNTTSLDRLKSGLDDQGKTFNDKLSSIQDSLHKQDVQGDFAKYLDNRTQ